MKKLHISLVVLIIALSLGVVPAFADGTVKLGWDANAEDDLAGYLICRGYASRVYDDCVDVGNNTTHTFTDVPEGVMQYYAAVAYNLEGDESNPSVEVPYALPAVDSDEDGLGDDVEVQCGTYDNISDSDNDGMPDGPEFHNWGQNCQLDSDGDFIPNIMDDDSDNDGWKDGEELAYGSDPVDASSVPRPPQAQNVSALIVNGQMQVRWDAILNLEIVDGYVVYYSPFPNAASPLMLQVSGEEAASVNLPSYVLQFPALYVSVAVNGFAGTGERSVEILADMSDPAAVKNVGGYLAYPHAYATWYPVAGASAYNIYYSYVPNAAAPSKISADGSETEKMIFYGAAYPALYIKVSAVVNGKEGPKSSEIKLK